MKTSHRCLAALLWLTLTGAAHAQEGDVSLQAGFDEPAWAGQALVLDLDLKTTGFSFSDVTFNLPEIEGAFLLQIDTTTVKLTEQRGGETWQVLRYPLTLYAQRGGTVSIPPIRVRFSAAMGFGSEPVAFDLASAPIEIDLRFPPGAPEDSVVVTTPSYTVREDWQLPDPPIEVGDALVLTVTQEAQGIPAMLLPPLALPGIPGLAAYPDPPDLEDRSNRGALTGRRTDRLTWIVERAGSYDIPGVRFRSWYPARASLRTQTVPGQRIEAEPGPLARPETPREDAGFDLSRGAVLRFALGLALLLLVGFWTSRQRERLVRLGRRILPPARALCDSLNPRSPS